MSFCALHRNLWMQSKAQKLTINLFRSDVLHIFAAFNISATHEQSQFQIHALR
jgi:hypothetical protein